MSEEPYLLLYLNQRFSFSWDNCWQGHRAHLVWCTSYLKAPDSHLLPLLLLVSKFLLHEGQEFDLGWQRLCSVLCHLRHFIVTGCSYSSTISTLAAFHYYYFYYGSSEEAHGRAVRCFSPRCHIMPKWTYVP